MAKRQTKTAPVSIETAAEEAVLVLPSRKTAIERKQEQEEALAGIKNKIFGASMKVVNNFLRAGDIDPEVDAARDPAYYEMMTELKDDEAVKRAYRVARTGWLPASETPGFVKIAANMAIGIMKANSAEKGGPKVLNVGRIMISAAAIPQFEEQDIE